MTMNKKKMRKGTNHKRFSEEQIKSLEVIFESETRLEPRKKMQLARELGLQPRQVAIWFQNKRARWKSKQLEKEYDILRANYNNLASQFEIIKKEKQALVSEVHTSSHHHVHLFFFFFLVKHLYIKKRWKQKLIKFI